jgi:hypothetical protein
MLFRASQAPEKDYACQLMFFTSLCVMQLVVCIVLSSSTLMYSQRNDDIGCVTNCIIIIKQVIHTCSVHCVQAKINLYAIQLYNVFIASHRPSSPTRVISPPGRMAQIDLDCVYVL